MGERGGEIEEEKGTDCRGRKGKGDTPRFLTGLTPLQIGDKSKECEMNE